jgi:predicted permease
LTAGLTLAVCVAANTALFAVVHNVLLRPLGIPDSDRVILVYNSYPNAGIEHARAAVPDYYDRLRDLTVFDEQALFDVANPSLEVNGAPERTHAMRATPSFLRLAGVRPRFGRIFTSEEGEAGDHQVVILSDILWQRLFGGDNAVGRGVRIDGALHTVVGVMPADFAFIDSDVQLWVPAAFTPQQKQVGQRHANNWTYIGRLKPGATLAQVQLQVDALNAANLERFPEFKEIISNAGFHSRAVRLQDDLVRDVRPKLCLLWGGALFVLLIGSMNVASLVLARSHSRLRELAMRTALGAGRWRIVRQLATEQLLLTMASAVAGLAAGYTALRWLGTVGIEHLPPGAVVQIGGRIIALTVTAALLIGLLLGAIPVLGRRRVDLTPVLRDDGRTGTGGRGARTLRRALVVTQVSAAFVLLLAAGLLFASFRRVAAVDPGFDPDGVLTATINLPPARYADSAAIRRFSGDVLTAIRSLPGVASAGATSSIPFGSDFSTKLILAEGYRVRPGEPPLGPYRNIVTPGYFEAMRVKPISGRLFEDRDSADAPNVIIVDAKLAGRFWPGADPVGRRMYLPSNPRNPLLITERTQRFTVVGVIGEMKLRGLVEGVGDIGAYYFAHAQVPERALTFAVRTSGDPSSVAGAVRGAIARLDSQLAVFDLRTMGERIDRSLVSRRLAVRLSAAFGAVALFLSAMGIYAVLAFLVASRTREIGVRMALGGSRRAVFQLILREVLLLIACGFALGAAGAGALGRSLESQLFGVRAADPVVLSMATTLLALVALAACVLPAHRATRIDPVMALND